MKQKTDMYTMRLDLTDLERRDLRILAARLDLTISAVVTDLVRRELGEAEKRPAAREEEKS